MTGRKGTRKEGRVGGGKRKVGRKSVYEFSRMLVPSFSTFLPPLYTSTNIQNENHRDTGNFCRALPMKRSLREMKVIRIEDSCLVDHAVFLIPSVAHIHRLNDFIYDSTVDRHSIADRW